MLSAFALVGCVDSNESASVEAVRNSKAEEQKALAAMYNAQAAAATTQAQADAALAQAQAALIQAQAEKAQADAEYQKIKNEYEKDKNNIELQTLLAQAEVAKAAAEQQIQQIKDQMELAVINQQKAIAEAQLALKQALDNLKAEDAREFQMYSGYYTSALSQVYTLQNSLAQTKYMLENYKFTNNLETQLANNGKDVESQIASYESSIAINERNIEYYKEQIQIDEAKLKYLNECEECKGGDLTALWIKYDEKTHEYQHAFEAYNEKRGGILSKLEDAIYDASDKMDNTQAGKALKQAVDDARQAMYDDEFYRLVNYYPIKVEGSTTPYYPRWQWSNLGFEPSTGASETYKKTSESLVAEAEYVNDYGDTKKAEYYLSQYWEFGDFSTPYELSASYSTNKSADQIRLAKENYEKQYESWIKNNEKSIGTAKWNVSVLEEYAKRLEEMARRDSVAVGRKACVDSVMLVYPSTPSWTYNSDSLKIEKCSAFSIAASEFTSYGSGYSYKQYFDEASNVNVNFVTTTEGDLESNKREQAAYKKFVDMIENSEDYAAEYAKKVDAYYAAMEAYVKDLAEAEVEKEAFYGAADEELKAVKALENEKDALWTAYSAMSNNNYAIENLENDIKTYNENIATCEANIENCKASIEEAKANGKVNEDLIKLNYENMIAWYEAQIKSCEEEIAVKQALVDMYKAILDSLVAEDAE